MTTKTVPESTMFWHMECSNGMSIDYKTIGEHKPDLPATMPMQCPICGEQHERARVTEEQHEAYKAECSGSGDCPAYYHEHGCFADLDGSTCNDPADHMILGPVTA